MPPRIDPVAEHAVAARPAQRGRGRQLAVGLVLLGLALAVFAVWFQWRQTRRCLAFYGADVAGRIQSADRVELWEFRGAAALDPLEPASRRDVTRAGGLVHLRRGLVEDANFDWEAVSAAAADGPARSGAGPRTWDVAIAFFDRAPEGPAVNTSPAAGGSASAESRSGAESAAVIVIDFDTAGGVLAVVGRPGEVGLGRMKRGLQTWVDATLAAGGR